MKKIILYTSILLFLFGCSDNEKETTDIEDVNENVEYSDFLNDTILLDFDAMKLEVIFESDSVLKWKLVDGNLTDFQTEKSQTIHLSNHSFITTWVETETDGDHITQFVDFETNVVASVIRKMDGRIFTVSGTISKTE